VENLLGVPGGVCSRIAACPALVRRSESLENENVFLRRISAGLLSLVPRSGTSFDPNASCGYRAQKLPASRQQLKASSRQLNPNIRITQHRVIEAIREIGHAGGERQLDDLLFGKVFAQFFEVAVAQCCRRTCEMVRVVDDRAVLFIKEVAAAVEGEVFNLVRGNADPLRRSGMGRGSIHASVDHGGLQISQFLIALVERAGSGNGPIEGQEGLEHFGLLGHDAEERGHLSEVFGHAFKNRLDIVGSFVSGYGFYSRHLSGLLIFVGVLRIYQRMVACRPIRPVPNRGTGMMD